MPAFPKPKPVFSYKLATEKKAVRAFYNKRSVPKAEKNKLLLASWNIANLGDQKRRDKDLELIAHMLKPFELIAVQEVKNRLQHFEKIMGFLGSKYEYVINDVAGNSERLAFIYRPDKVTPGRLFGEIAFPKTKYPREDVVVSYGKKLDKREVYPRLEFVPFDRNPFVGSFTAGKLSFTIVNTHLFFGSSKDKGLEDRAKYARRVMEVHAMSRWAGQKITGKDAYDKDIVLLGDMNIPVMDKNNAAYRALLKSGFVPVKYLDDGRTNGSNLSGTKSYDQIAMAPGDMRKRLLDQGVIDFDNGVFKGLWNKLQSQNLTDKKRASAFNKHVKFYLSDHRPLWVQLDTK